MNTMAKILRVVKKHLLAALLASTIGLCSSAQAETLKDVIGDAIKNHPAVAAKEASQDVYQWDVREQKSAWFPTVSASASTGREFINNDTSRSFTTDGGDYSWVGSGSIAVNQLLFDANETSNRISAARARNDAAEFGVGDVQEDIAARAAQAHLNVMRSRELIALAKEHLKTLEKYQSDIQLMYQEGALDEAELLQAQELNVSTRAKLLSFEDQLKKAEANFMEAVGRAPGPQLEVSEPWQKSMPENLSTAIIIGQRESPKIAATEKTADAFTSDAKAEKARRMPRVNAEMSYAETDQKDTVGGETTNAQALVRMNWNFSTGGAEKARIHRAESRRNEALAQKEELLRRIEQQVRTSYADVEITKQQKELLKEREEANRKIVEKFRQQFEAGTRTTLQIMNIETRFFDSTVDRINSGYRFTISNMQLLATMGRLRNAILSEYNLVPETTDGSNG